MMRGVWLPDEESSSVEDVEASLLAVGAATTDVTTTVWPPAFVVESVDVRAAALLADAKAADAADDEAAAMREDEAFAAEADERELD